MAHQVGYEDPAYFSRIFKKHKGMSPSKYRNG
ncbi:MAG: AraC family transcriptional regulator [Lentisphaeria bacterium]|nr:AraC family transcriptional regulator [Lentisphaeria bacterium]